MPKGLIYMVQLEGDGHEQTGMRPAIVIGNVVGDMVVIIPLTTNVE